MPAAGADRTELIAKAQTIAAVENVILTMVENERKGMRISKGFGRLYIPEWSMWQGSRGWGVLLNFYNVVELDILEQLSGPDHNRSSHCLQYAFWMKISRIFLNTWFLWYFRTDLPHGNRSSEGYIKEAQVRPRDCCFCGKIFAIKLNGHLLVDWKEA